MMANRLKEDEKNERIIRNLLKLPENRRCINCNSLGPQYVCTNFSTFVCTTCGGIHREFTHRVKSVSMAKFTPQEVSALQGGGNVRAKEIYLKEWDPQRNSLPDGSNVERLRDFIKHVYVDRRFTGERNVEKPPRAKMAESEDFSGNRRIDIYQEGSRSPPYDDFERRHSDRSSPGGRSPGYEEDIRQNSNYRRSPAYAEVVNDWRREDRFGNGRRSEGRSSDGGSKVEGGSPDSQRDLDVSSPPVVRPVRDILGENVSPLRVIEPPKTTSGKSPDGSQTLRTVSSSSMASSVVNPTEIKVEASFIDFDSVPETAATASVNKQMSVDASSSMQMTASTGGNDWANFDLVTQMKVYNAASTSVESVLSELSITAPTAGPATPVGNLPPFQPSGSQGLSFVSSFGSNAPPSVLPPVGAPSASLGPPAQQVANVEGSLLVTTTAPTGGLWPSLHPQQNSLVSDDIGQPLSQQVGAPVIGGSLTNKAWNPLAPKAPRQPIEQADASSAAKVGQSASFGLPTISSSEAKSGGRKALPEDLFTVNYSYTPSPVFGWYSGSPYVAGFPMHYNMPMAVPNFQPVSRSTNPFDVGNEPSPVQVSTFPSVASLQDALPKTATPSGLLRTSSFGAPLPHSAHPQMPSHASAVAQSAFTGQEITYGMVPSFFRPQGQSGFNLDQPVFAPLNSNPHLSGLHPPHSTTSNFTSASGNPFG